MYRLGCVEDFCLGEGSNGFQGNGGENKSSLIEYKGNTTED